MCFNDGSISQVGRQRQAAAGGPTATSAVCKTSTHSATALGLNFEHKHTETYEDTAHEQTHAQSHTKTHTLAENECAVLGRNDVWCFRVYINCVKASSTWSYAMCNCTSYTYIAYTTIYISTTKLVAPKTLKATTQPPTDSDMFKYVGVVSRGFSADNMGSHTSASATMCGYVYNMFIHIRMLCNCNPFSFSHAEQCMHSLVSQPPDRRTIHSQHANQHLPLEVFPRLLGAFVLKCQAAVWTPKQPPCHLTSALAAFWPVFMRHIQELLLHCYLDRHRLQKQASGAPGGGRRGEKGYETQTGTSSINFTKIHSILFKTLETQKTRTRVRKKKCCANVHGRCTLVAGAQLAPPAHAAGAGAGAATVAGN